VKTENLGVVKNITDDFVFVVYNGQTNAQATRAEDLYSLKNRPDLAELIK